MSDVCSQCGDSYESIGIHWSKSSCEYPDLSQRQIEVLTGLIMGDGSVNRRENRTPRVECEMITKEYLQYLDKDVFPFLGRGVKLRKTAEESAAECRDSGFSEGAKAENYSDVYRWYTRSNLNFNVFSNWYNSGKKTFPKNLKLTPTILKHWYCCDGCYANKNSKDYITFAISNERENRGKIESMFEEISFPIDYWNERKREDGSWKCDISFNKRKSNDMLVWMGKPLPGFEYKW